MRNSGVSCMNCSSKVIYFWYNDCKNLPCNLPSPGLANIFGNWVPRIFDWKKLSARPLIFFLPSFNLTPFTLKLLSFLLFSGAFQVRLGKNRRGGGLKNCSAPFSLFYYLFSPLLFSFLNKKNRVNRKLLQAIRTIFKVYFAYS